MSDFTARYKKIRNRTVSLCSPLKIEDYVAQPVVDVSPPKWHLGHTTWFFETFLLMPHLSGYQCFDDDFSFVFNSYYESVGKRVMRADRGNLTRPTTERVYEYRDYVDKNMAALLSNSQKIQELSPLLELGLQHEQQHQELLLTDIKYILGHNPLFPPYDVKFIETPVEKNGSSFSKYDEGLYEIGHDPLLSATDGKSIENPEGKNGLSFMEFDEGLYEIGHDGGGFCFDNELNRHKVFLPAFAIRNSLVTNGEFMEFMADGGYGRFQFWHSDGWEWVKTNKIAAPHYWHQIEGTWYRFDLSGFKKVDANEPVTHISFYEASAFAEWKGCRLPTEQEWETAASKISWGQRWEWTNSAYLPYPGFKKADGAIGEYNGKFMVNQMVLRGGSVATPEGHSRATYRNFFQPPLRWQFTGIRLAKKQH